MMTEMSWQVNEGLSRDMAGKGDGMNLGSDSRDVTTLYTASTLTLSTSMSASNIHRYTTSLQTVLRWFFGEQSTFHSWKIWLLTSNANFSGFGRRYLTFWKKSFLQSCQNGDSVTVAERRLKGKYVVYLISRLNGSDKKWRVKINFNVQRWNTREVSEMP